MSFQRDQRIERYRQLCASPAQPSLFQQDWWLDVTVGEGHWDVVLAESGGQIQAALPYILKSRYGVKFLTQGPLTQFLGPWIRTTGAKEANRASREKDLLTNLIFELPKHDVYRQNWSPNQQNWLPFYWEGFSQTTKYTYKLHDIGDSERLWRGLRENIRTDIRKASGKYGIETQGVDISELLKLNAKTFARQGRKPPHSDTFLRKIYEAARERGRGRVMGAVDKDGCIHAAVLLVWDNSDTYYLLGGGDPELRSSGATSLCLWNAIQFAASVSERFDFEGSMIEPIERYFRAFGGVRTPYFAISRVNSKPLRLISAVVSALRG